MCGIAGILSLNGRPAEPSVLARMIRTICYRGPDGTGQYTCGPVGLAHNRLSIIDVAGGSQPMASDDGSLWITFNGEIFNYVELREDLVKKGYTFTSRSDTEVILKLYQEFGPECVGEMNGQWSFGIWDARKRRLFLSRDRLGVRPLFYTMVGHTFIFGSEVKALLAHPGVDRDLDLQGLRQIFTYWFPVPPRTVFKDISELPPGHCLLIENGEIQIRRYFQLDFSPGDAAKWEEGHVESAYRDELCHLLLDATRIRLRADVPVAAYLSGGLDSSIITGLAQRFVGENLHTFSVAFEDATLDESRFQAEVARHLNTRHETIRCSTTEIGRAFPDVIRHVERPILRTAPAPMYLLSELVSRNGFKVVLTGEGSDEFLGGYDIYKEAKARVFWATQIDSKLRPLLLRRLYPYLDGIQRQPLPYLQAFFHVRPTEVHDPFFSHIPRWELSARSHVLFSAAVRAEWKKHSLYRDLDEFLPEGFSVWTTFSRAQYLEAAFLLPNYLLSSQGDRVAMAHSVEGRYPFLDHRVVDFATRLPPRLKMKVLNEKYLLKQTFGHLIPASVKRRPKQPYRAPDSTSFFDPTTGKALHPYVEELLSSERIRANGIFDLQAVQGLVDKVKRGRTFGFLANASLVGVLSTQLVIDQFITQSEVTKSNAAD